MGTPALAAFSLFKIAYRLIGPALRGHCRRRRGAHDLDLDRTGSVVKEPKVIETFNDASGRRIFAYFDPSLAHSL